MDNATEYYSQSSTAHTGEEQLVIAIDAGTTMTAVAFVYLYPGVIPQVKIVNRWPGQEDASGDSKIPSLVAYRAQKAVAFGAEALEYVGDEDIVMAKWFKLHLHPDTMKMEGKDPGSNLEVPPLPPSTTIKRVYADFLRYAFDHTKSFFRNHTVDGDIIWDRLADRYKVVLATPNGWEIAQHHLLQTAVEEAEILPINLEDDRLLFVTESEASVHFALHHTQAWLRKSRVFLTTDLGGSTVDSNLYECQEVSPKLALTEVRSSECVQAGSVFVDRAFEVLMKEKLKPSAKYSDASTLRDIVNEFERKTKRKFDGTQRSSIIKFGRDSDNDKKVGIVRGRITLTQEEVQSTFTAAIERTIASCTQLINERQVSHWLLVGGFAESQYLQNRLKEHSKDLGIKIVTVDESTKKAAAEGAILWYLKQHVTARATRVTFGCRCFVVYNPNITDHVARREFMFVDADGVLKIPGHFDLLVKKDQVISESWSFFRGPYTAHYRSVPEVGYFDLELFAYDGEGSPLFTDTEEGVTAPQFRQICILSVDLAKVKHLFKSHKGTSGQVYWTLQFNVLLFFGGVSMKAKLQWDDNGQMQEGPISILPTHMY